MFFGKSKDGSSKSSPTTSASLASGWSRGVGQLFDATTGRNKGTAQSGGGDVLLEDLHIIKENQRLNVHSLKWSSKHLTGDDPKSFTSMVGSTDIFPMLPIQKGWEYSSEWRVDLDYIKLFIPDAAEEYYERDSDDGFDEGDEAGAGWVYALSFEELYMGKIVPPTKGALVRQRRHIRRLIFIQSNYLYASMPNEIEPEFGQFDIEIEDDGEPDDTTTVLSGSDHTPTPPHMLAASPNQTSSAALPQFRKPQKGFSRSSILSNISTVFGRASVIATSSGGESVDPLWKVGSPELIDIGKKIRILEAEVKKYTEQQQRMWLADDKPRLEEDIAQLEKQCSLVVTRIENEASLGADHVQGLEDALRDLGDQLDQKKRRLFFPDSSYTFGSQGVYFGLDAFWLQFASGHFILNLTPDSVLHALPHISLLLGGTSKNPASGVTIKCKLEGFKLKGDRGTKVPKLNFENLKLQVGLTLTMKITYDMEKQCWSLPANRFNLKIISFKGPYGLNRSIVGMVLSFLTPIIRAKLIQLIPYELGVFVQSFPSPFSVKGEFDMHGIDMNLLHVDLFRNDIFLELCEYSRPQLEMFMAMQRSMERPTMLRSISDLIVYQRKHKVHREKWPLMLWLWREASAVYSEAVTSSKLEQSAASDHQSFNPEDHCISFDTIMRACDDIQCKRTAANCTLQYIDGQVSVNMFLQFFFQVQYRLASEQLNKAAGIAKVRLQAFMDIVQKQYDVSVAVLHLLCQNVDFAHLTVLGELHSGPQGEAHFKVKDLLAQAPMMVNLSIQTDKNLGCLPLVPFMLSFQPQPNGDVCIELYHFNQELVNPEVQNGNTVAKYSNHYNKVLNKVTHNRKMGLSRGAPKEELGSTARCNLSKSYTGSGVGRCATGSQDDSVTASNSFPTTHLTVRQYDLESSLAWTLQDYPKNEESDTILVVVATNPHLSVIVDKPVKLQAGTELFTFILGPKVMDWKPLGKATLLDPSNDFRLEHNTRSPSESQHHRPSSDRRRPHSVLRTTPLEQLLRAPDVLQTASLLTGCPIKIQTAPGIKLLFQTAKSYVNVNTSGFFRFLLAHFADVTLLKEYLEICGLFTEEQLRVTQKIIEKTAKYLMLPGVDLDLNINFRLVTLNNEFMVRIETPQSTDQVEHDQLHSDGYTRGDYQSLESLSAVNLRVELSLVGLMDDIRDFIHYAARLFEITTPIPGAAGSAAGADYSDHNLNKKN